MADKPEPGSIVWTDLTVQDAEGLREFYENVVGWKVDEVPMKDYSDFSLNLPGSGQPVAGVCHARGVNADLPPQWLMYVTVENLDHSMERCRELGGEVIAGPRPLAGGRFCVVRDPAGAVCGILQPGD